MNEQNAIAAQRMSISAAVQMLVFIIAVVVIWLLLVGYVLHLRAGFAGFLFLWYWGAVEKADFGRLLPSALGAVLGAVLVWQMLYLPAQFGTAGLVAGLAVLAAMVFVQLMNWAPLLVNNSTMLFLTVLTAPALIGTVKFQDVAISVAVGTVYFAAAAYVAKAYAGARVRAKLQTA
jgi:hypothetical protein